MERREFMLAPALAAAPAEWVSSRPRLYFDVAAVKQFRARLTASAKAKQEWSRALSRAETLLKAEPVPESVAEEGGGQHANYGRPSGQISEMGLTFGLAFHVTGEKRWAEKLRETMLAYVEYKRWAGQGLDDRVPPWHSELNTARFCFGYGAGYDALHDYLSAADRKRIADGMVRLGILPTLDDWILAEKRIHALDSMGHNWWSVCIGMAGVRALALLGDDGRAPGWIDEIQRGFERWFEYQGNVLQNKPANFDSNGAFYESLGYTNYALSEYLRFRLAYANVFRGRPQPRFAPLERTVEFFLQTLYPTSSGYWTPAIGDGGSRQGGAATVRLLHETGFTHPAASWYVARTGGQGRSDTLEMLFRQPLPAPAAPSSLPESSRYPHIGWATMRNSWKDDATFVAVKSGTAWNHAHADAGSFVLYHGGQRLIVDSGRCSYSHRAYAGYYTQSRAHNVILFNGQGEPEEDHLRGVKFPGRLPSALDGQGVKYVYSDATGPTARYFCRNYRHWLWVGGVILVFDDLLAYEPGRFDWLLHYEGRPETGPNRVLIANGGARAEVRFLYPFRLDMREEDGHTDGEPDRVVKYLVFSAAGRFRDQKFATAIIPLPGGDAAGAPAVELFDTGSTGAIDQISGAPGGPSGISTAPDKLGVRIRHGSEITDVYLNVNADGRRMHVNTNNILGGWDTDAYLLALTRPAAQAQPTPDNVRRYFVACASYLRKGETVVLSSLSKIDAALRPRPVPELALRSQEAVDVEVIAREAVPSVLVNGSRLSARFNPRRKVVAVRIAAPARS